MAMATGTATTDTDHPARPVDTATGGQLDVNARESQPDNPDTKTPPTLQQSSRGFVSPFESGSEAEFGAGILGMKLFLVSLAMLFGASLLGFVIIRIQLRHVWPDDLPALPALLWLGTAMLIISSVTMQLALASVRKGVGSRFSVLMIITLLLGLGFIFVQALSWRDVLAAMETAWVGSEQYRYALASFYVLSGVHALHVIGGLLPMAVITKRALRGRYAADRYAGVAYCAMYWHFLDGVWVILFATLLLGL